ncbi:dephospho-CoA kinase [Hespellia stercorisuis]|uniref:Dephospho-CoA kinase n=1 Tax=Hespellia stercorisuis DSM 15480 TaxID=1121950 RepID=A0A1M6NA54_9FIRM|nr:dephospho-CoA kinase [Hespellia stercorisuis]SHJ92575.1 dephospho-CoA kinase [Hespellia stercorisuis DSM 15480]
MIIIGITGGVGSGKSMVLRYLEREHSAAICKADEVAKLLQQSGQPVFEAMVEHFGLGIVNESGELDREQLRGFVFEDEQEMQFLNSLIHPKVKEYILHEIEQQKNRHTKLFVVEAALLIEENYDAVCDEMWYIHTDESIRRNRLKVSRGYTDSQIDAIIGKQQTESVFRAKCQTTIENGGDFEETKAQIIERIQILERKMEK